MLVGPKISRREVPGLPLASGTELALEGKTVPCPPCGRSIAFGWREPLAIRQLKLESMLDCGTWKVGRTSVGKQGHCFLEVVGAWLPEKSAGGPGLYPLEPGAECQMAAGTPLLAQQSFSRQQLQSRQRGRLSSRGCLWERPQAWAHRGPLWLSVWPRSFCSPWFQAVSAAGGSSGGSWVAGTPHHILVDSVQSQSRLSSQPGRGRLGAGLPLRKLCRERRREPRRFQSLSWGSLGLPGWWGMHSRALRLGSRAAGLQRVMKSRQLASRRKMQARASSAGRGSAASVGLPGVTGAVRKARGLGPRVLMAPATGRGTLMGAGCC